MMVVVVGAAGRTGAAVAQAALAQGHAVRGVGARRGVDPQVVWFEGDTEDPAVLAAAFAGADAVVCAIGPTARHPHGAGAATAAILAAMRRLDVPRLVVVTGAMVGAPTQKLSWLYRMIRAVPSVAVEIEDRRTQESLVCASDRLWTILRPARLTDDPAGSPRVGEDLPVGLFAHTARMDLAAVAVPSLGDPALCDRAHTVLS